MKIGFHSNQLGLRGTEVALFDYAYFNRELLKNESVIISDKNASMGMETLSKFTDEFPVELYSNFGEVEAMVDKHKLDAIFYIKHGANDGKIVKNAKNWVQAIFRVYQPHGDKYFYNSFWLANYMQSNMVIPHIVRKLPETDLNYREYFGIPKEATVFGFHGGRDSFNIDFVKKTVDLVALTNPNIYFLFMNVDRFSNQDRVIHVAGTYDLMNKSQFINTCDAMLYARECGETFGLSVAEFSVKNKPCIVYKDSPERHHIDCLRDAGYYYGNSDELRHILENFKTIFDPSKKYDRYTDLYSPAIVMNQFRKLLIDEKAPC